jgi:hypothetical protein
LRDGKNHAEEEGDTHENQVAQVGKPGPVRPKKLIGIARKAQLYHHKANDVQYIIHVCDVTNRNVQEQVVEDHHQQRTEVQPPNYIVAVQLLVELPIFPEVERKLLAAFARRVQVNGARGPRSKVESEDKVLALNFPLRKR